MPQTVVNIPGVGQVNFPDSMSPADIEREASKLHEQASGAPKARGLVAEVDEALDGMRGNLAARPGDGMIARGAKGIGRGALGFATMPWEIGKAATEDPHSDAVDAFGVGGRVLKKLVLDPASKMMENAVGLTSRFVSSAAHGGKPEKGDLLKALGYGGASLAPMVGPYLANLAEQAGAGDLAGAVTEGATTFLAPTLLKAVPGMARAARPVPGELLRAVTEAGGRAIAKPFQGGAERMAETPIGGPAISGGGSRANVADFAKQRGIDLLPGQATESRPLQSLQAVGERTMFGGEKIQRHVEGNRARLVDEIDNLKERQAPGVLFPDREAIGTHLKEQTGSLRDDLKKSAQADFDDWRNETGGFQVDMTPLQEKYSAKLKEMKAALANTPKRYAAPIHELLDKAANFGKVAPEETVMVDGKEMKVSELNDTLKKATGYQSQRPGYAEAVEDSVDQRLEAMRQEFTGGQNEMTGKTKREYFNEEDPTDQGRVVGRFGGSSKLLYPELDSFMQSPGVIAEAIARGDKKSGLYQRVREAAKKLVEQEQGPAIHEYLDSQGIPATPAAKPGSEPLLDVSTLQQLRTAFWEIANDFEGTTGKRHNAIASEIVHDLDQAMEAAADEAGTLETWRRANKQWRTMEELFNKHDSPLTQVLKENDPGRVVQKLTRKGDIGGSAHSLRMAKDAGVDLGPVRRHVVEDIKDNNFKPGKGGKYLGGYSHDFLKELFAPEELEELYLLGRTGRALNFEVNPSGTSNVEGMRGEIGNILGRSLRAMTGPAAAKLTLSPRFSEIMTGKSKPAVRAPRPSLLEEIQKPRQIIPRESVFAAGSSNRKRLVDELPKRK